MARGVFSVPIFFIVFRETLEAAIIVSVLLGLVEQIVHDDSNGLLPPMERTDDEKTSADGGDSDKDKSGHTDGAAVPTAHELAMTADDDDALRKKRLIRKMRIQIFAGSALGLFIALAIGAAFIAVWFTKASNLWQKSEEIWEGTFELIAAIIIFIMGVTMLKLDRAKTKWRIKLTQAFEGKHVDGRTRAGRWVLFFLPFITVLREGMEAVIFVAVSRSARAPPPSRSPRLSASSSASSAACSSTCSPRAPVRHVPLLVPVRSALTLEFTRSTDDLPRRDDELHPAHRRGTLRQVRLGLPGERVQPPPRRDVDDAGGDGPGSFNVHGNVWHLDCCNPDNNFDNNGWTIFGAIFGWTNSATLGSVLAYVFYWIAVIATLLYLKWKEGRTNFGVGFESRARIERREKRNATVASLPQ
ncbi:hypothetical protein EWM64_g1164 [Hericium alpestre]|uniref:Plasma membrane iron permease n=1 Tax=Hericium alpestre TaxID=135208 RepID=A0A4Z0A7Y2_9AGAM|nr:hypothetical protein EWM64_g1164 [Hericium alpestre]